jgi:hypothetical protein
MHVSPSPQALLSANRGLGCAFLVTTFLVECWALDFN